MNPSHVFAAKVYVRGVPGVMWVDDYLPFNVKYESYGNIDL